MDEKLQLIAKSFGEDKIKFNEELKYHLATRMGGPAKLFAVAVSEREIIKIVEDCQQLKVPFLMIGTGSKIVISDQGFDGVIIKNRTQSVKIISIKGKVGQKGLGVDSVLIEVDGGVIVSKFVEFLIKQGLEYEEFENVTGSIGGNIFINRSLQEKSERIKVLNLEGDIEIIQANDLNLRNHIVLSVVLKIKAK